MDPNTLSTPQFTATQPAVVYIMPQPNGAMPIAQGYPGQQTVYSVPAGATPMPVYPQPGSPVVVMPAVAPHAVPMAQIPLDQATPDVHEIKTIRERLEERDYNLDLPRWLSQALALYKVNNNWLKLLVWSCVYLGLCFIPFGFGVILLVPLKVGFTIAVFNALRTSSANPMNLQVRDFLPPLKLSIMSILLVLLQTLFILLGFIALIVPGLYLSISLAFAFPAYVEFSSMGLSMMDAFKVSNKLTWKKFVNFIVFSFLISFIVLVGVLCLIVGVLVSLPIGLLAYTIAAKEMFGLRDTHEYDMGVANKI